MPELPSCVSGVVFDFDGVMADTEPRWGLVEAALFAPYGVEYTAEVRTQMLGLSVEGTGRRAAEIVGHPERFEELHEQIIEGARAEFGKGVEPMPGIADLIGAWHGRIPMGVASNSPRRVIEVSLPATGLEPLLTASVTYDEVARAKPAPDLYLEACRLIGADPTRAVAVEDSRTGAVSAREAGMFVIGLPPEGHEIPEAHLTVSALTDLVAWANRVDLCPAG